MAGSKIRKSLRKLADLPGKLFWTPYDCYKIVRAAYGKLYGEYEPAELLTPHPNLARRMREADDIGFTADSNGDVIVRYGDIRCRIRELCDLNTAREIYMAGQYRFQPSGDCVVVDIGANIGMASLYFADMPQVKAVIGFEPFKPTYEQNLGNLSLNPHLAPKITVHNVGLSDQDAELEVDYCPGISAAAGIEGPIIDVSHRSVVREKIRITRASEAVNAILTQYPDLDLVIKMDCEGSEYEIMVDLDEAGLIPKVSVFLMEWHLKGPDLLTSHLQKHNFTWLSPGVNNGKIMMLYAFRQR